MASEQDEEEEQVSGEWRRTRSYNTALVFWDTGNCLILSHAAPERRLWMCEGSGGGLGTDTALGFWDTGTYRMLRESDVCELVCEAGVMVHGCHRVFSLSLSLSLSLSTRILSASESLYDGENKSNWKV